MVYYIVVNKRKNLRDFSFPCTILIADRCKFYYAVCDSNDCNFINIWSQNFSNANIWFLVCDISFPEYVKWHRLGHRLEFVC